MALISKQSKITTQVMVPKRVNSIHSYRDFHVTSQRRDTFRGTDGDDEPHNLTACSVSKAHYRPPPSPFVAVVG